MINLKFWEPREEFLLIEILPKKTKGLLLSIDEDKNITLSKSWNNFELKKIASPARKLKNRQLIVAAGPTLGVSLELPVKVKRENNLTDRPIVPTEFDNLLAQSIDKSFSNIRKIASSRFGTDELDTVLVGIKAKHFKVDGHSVFNPMGFSGNSLSAVLELTFTVRDIFETLKDHFSSRDGFFFTTSIGSVVGAVSRLNEASNFLVLRPERSSVFWRDDGIHEENLEWSLANLLEAIASKVPIKEEPGAENFLGGSFILDDHSIIQPIIKQHLRNLARELGKLNKNKTIYMQLSEPLPLSLPRREGGVSFDYLPLKPTIEKLGFGLDFSKWNVPDDAIFSSLAPFFEFYSDPGNSEIATRLRRKINWLAR